MIHDWRAQALCARITAAGKAKHDDWCLGSGTIGRAADRAVKICGHCPVRAACRDWAISEARDGIRPRSTVLGGWIWRDATLRPYPTDKHLVALVPDVESAA